MFRKTKIQIANIRSENDKVLLETEIDVLRGVKNVEVDEGSGEVWIEFDDSKISRDKLLEIIQDFGFQREYTYFVRGMHCASCEILIEKKLLSLEGIKSVEASADKGSVLVVYDGKKPDINALNEIFKRENYLFFDRPLKTTPEKDGNDYPVIIATAALFIAAFFLLKNSGFAGLINVSSASSLSMFFFLGLLAGISSCAALVGGLVLSMSKQWLEKYSEKDSTLEKLQPHLMFNIGRIASYAILGGALGLLGSKLQISLTFTSLLIIAVSVMMTFLALQMLGVKAFRKFQFTMPRFITKYVADETNFQAKYMPFLMGALTFFLPCGFTITAQGLALISGSPIQGALIMLAFVLGTSPTLLAIGLSAVKFSEKPHLSYKFLKVGGILVLFFALYNINSQLNVLGFFSLSYIKRSLNNQQGYQNSGNQQINNGNEDGLPPIVDGKQVIKMDAFASGYQPNYFKVKAGIPVRWEIKDAGTSGCTNAVISQGLFQGAVNLTVGQTSIKEFTPAKAGKYKFSCWMGMISGIIEVVGAESLAKIPSANAQSPEPNSEAIIPSGAKGCGCGGGGSCGSTKNL